MKIERERYVIVKRSRHGMQILCTTANKPKFQYILRLGNEMVRSYSSPKRAMQAFRRFYNAPWNPKRFRVERVIESYESVTLRSERLKDLRKRAKVDENVDETIKNFYDPDAELWTPPADFRMPELTGQASVFRETLMNQMLYDEDELRDDELEALYRQELGIEEDSNQANEDDEDTEEE